jgi:hypothetical protein
LCGIAQKEDVESWTEHNGDTDRPSVLSCHFLGMSGHKMTLTLRTTGLSPPADQHLKNYTVFQDSHPIGRLYEDLPAGGRQKVRWSWSINTLVDARAGVRTEGRTASFEEAKTHFQENWERWKAWAKIAGQPTLRSR